MNPGKKKQNKIPKINSETTYCLIWRNFPNYFIKLVGWFGIYTQWLLEFMPSETLYGPNKIEKKFFP